MCGSCEMMLPLPIRDVSEHACVCRADSPCKHCTPQGVCTRAAAGVGSTGGSTGGALRQRVQQRLGLLEVSGVKALGEPMVDGCQEVMGFLALALLLPQASQTRSGS